VCLKRVPHALEPSKANDYYERTNELRTPEDIFTASPTTFYSKSYFNTTFYNNSYFCLYLLRASKLSIFTKARPTSMNERMKNKCESLCKHQQVKPWTSFLLFFVIFFRLFFKIKELQHSRAKSSNTCTCQKVGENNITLA